VLCGIKSQWGGGGETRERQKRTMTFIVVHFRDSLVAGPPTSWVSPCASSSPNPLLGENELPTSLWKGEGLVQLYFCVSALARGIGDRAHIPQERGGAFFQVDVCDWEGGGVTKMLVVVVR